MGEMICHSWKDAINSEMRQLFFPQNVRNSPAHEFFPMAQKGDAWSQGKLAGCYQLGYGVKPNPQEGSRWAKLSADQGHPEGHAALSWAYLNSEAKKLNFSEGHRLVSLSAAKGNPRGQVMLAACYLFGHGAKKDHDEALRLFDLALEKGWISAARVLGKYYSGEGPRRNLEEGYRLLRYAALKGDVRAVIELSKLYETNTFGAKNGKEHIRLEKLVQNWMTVNITKMDSLLNGELS